MSIQKVLFINIFILKFLLEINEKTLANEIYIKLPFSKDLNSTLIFDDFKKNTYSNKEFNKDSYFIKNKTSIKLFKNNFLEKQNIQDFNKQKSLLINNQSSLKKEYNPTFKDISKTFLSPYGGHVPRAPDESLEACNTKECYE